MPTPEQALPGRAERMSVPAQHYVNGARLQPPFPAGLKQALFGMGCFWGAEKKFWQLPGVYTTAVGYAGGFTPNPDLPRGLQRHDRPQRGRARGVRPGEGLATTRCSRRSGRTTTRRRACGRATTPARSTARGSTTSTTQQRAAAERSRDAFQQQLSEARLRRDHDRDPAGAGVLLRRGLPPAVPREESRRLLRPRRNRRDLPGGADRRQRGLTKSWSATVAGRGPQRARLRGHRRLPARHHRLRLLVRALPEDHPRLLPDRPSVPWWAICFTIVATETSTLTFIGVPGRGLRRQHDVPAARARLRHRPHPRQRAVHPRVLPRRALHLVRAAAAALRPARQERRGGHLPGHALAGRRHPAVRDRAGHLRRHRRAGAVDGDRARRAR